VSGLLFKWSVTSEPHRLNTPTRNVIQLFDFKTEAGSILSLLPSCCWSVSSSCLSPHVSIEPMSRSMEISNGSLFAALHIEARRRSVRREGSGGWEQQLEANENPLATDESMTGNSSTAQTDHPATTCSIFDPLWSSPQRDKGHWPLGCPSDARQHLAPEPTDLFESSSAQQPADCTGAAASMPLD